ncbi:hypothetical protein ACIQM3_34770 [Streptomyces sp. NPDC091271]|uniref:hypothetical protein n=1 Tax=Streptomyces sp. NPDC091271 TaxID=3365980 RepID=UPI00381071AC
MFVLQTLRDITVRSLIQKLTSNPAGRRVMKTARRGLGEDPHDGEAVHLPQHVSLLHEPVGRGSTKQTTENLDAVTRPAHLSTHGPRS